MARDAALRRTAPHLRPAADVAMAQMHASTYAALSAAGFSGSSARACHTLAEVMKRFLALLARRTTAHAELAGRSDPHVADALAAMDEILGTDDAAAALHEWVSDEHILKRALAWPAPWAAQHRALAELQAHAPDVAALAWDDAATLSFMPVDDAHRAELEARQALDASLEDDLVWGEAAYLPLDAHPAERRATAPRSPPPLPPMPSLAPSAASPERASPPPAAPAPSVQRRVRAMRVRDDGLRRVWREAAASYRGTLSGTDDARAPLPAYPADRAAKRQKKSTSSLDAFMHAVDALRADPASRTPVLLTSLARSHHANPTSTAAMAAAYKRRRLAHTMADPLRYVPNDSIHGCVHVHPVAPASAPGASLLITIPPAKDGTDEDAHAASAAPIFTQVHPHGRVIALVPPSGAHAPTLGYRHGALLYHGARMLLYPDMQRVFARLADPPAVLDAHHTEQVYHGTAASRTMMSGTMMSVRHRDTPSVMVSKYRGANSVLHPALERLRFHLAAQLEAARRAAQAEGVVSEVEEPIRGERVQLPTKGTLVHAWDWKRAEPCPPPA